MIEHYVPSLGLKRGCRAAGYSTVTELDNAAGESGACLKFANSYLIQKGSLVDFRDAFVTKLEEVTGFKMKTIVEEKKKTDGTVEKTEKPDETEVQFVSRFRKAVINGDAVLSGVDKDSLEDYLQNLADGLGQFPADAKKPERSAKPKTPPKWIMERVETIWQNGTQDKWHAIMVKEGITVPEFTADTTANKLAMAWAIREREERKTREEAKQYA